MLDVKELAIKLILGTTLLYIIVNVIMAPLFDFDTMPLSSAFGFMLFGLALTADSRFKPPKKR